VISTSFYWLWLCSRDGGHMDDLDAWCAGPRSMDNCTEVALTA
jgi:hypothetical protein